MNTIETLDALKRSYGDVSDYNIAKKIGISRQYISMMRTGKEKLTRNQRIEVAKLLNEPVELHLIYHQQERAIRPEEKNAWQHALEKLTTAAASVLLGLALFLPAADVPADPPETNDTCYTLCALSLVVVLKILLLFELIIVFFGLISGFL